MNEKTAKQITAIYDLCEYVNRINSYAKKIMVENDYNAAMSIYLTPSCEREQAIEKDGGQTVFISVSDIVHRHLEEMKLEILETANQRLKDLGFETVKVAAYKKGKGEK